MIHRTDWGAKGPRAAYTPHAVERVVIHHTAAPARLIKRRWAEKAYMRTLQLGHFARGFSDIGYHRVIFPSGRVYEGRPLGAVGAGVYDHNTGTAHYTFAGNFEIEKPTQAALEACADQMTQDRTRGLPRFGHYQLTPTLCPGRRLKPHVQSLMKGAR